MQTYNFYGTPITYTTITDLLNIDLDISILKNQYSNIIRNCFDECNHFHLIKENSGGSLLLKSIDYLNNGNTTFTIELKFRKEEFENKVIVNVLIDRNKKSYDIVDIFVKRI